MSCSFPGCLQAQLVELVRVRSERVDVLSRLEDRGEPGVARLYLCATHRAEFERLGWLAEPEERDA